MFEHVLSVEQSTFRLIVLALTSDQYIELSVRSLIDPRGREPEQTQCILEPLLDAILTLTHIFAIYTTHA